MAKQRGPVASTFSGRVGNVVGAKLKGGEYVTRSYQPSVKNPNTLRQRVSRLRIATAAQLAAGLAPAIVAGYGKASGSTKMYPRNMFVRELVKMDGMGALTVQNETAEINYEVLKLSERIGISAIPSATAEAGSQAGRIEVSIAPLPVTDVLPAGDMGAVCVAYNPVKGACVVKMVVTSPTNDSDAAIKCPDSWSGDVVKVYAFCKFIPESKNDITTDTEPWKYPAETGETVYLGEVNVE